MALRYRRIGRHATSARLLSIGAVVAATPLALIACSSSGDAASGDKTAAVTACRESVRQKLSITNDASFTDETSSVTNYGYKIFGWVEAPQVTKVHFLCSAEHNGTRWVGAQVVLNP